MMDDMERAWAVGGAAEEIMEDIEQTWAAGGDAEGGLELAQLRASQAAKIDAQHNRLKWLDDLEEDGNGGDEAQEATLRPAWQGRMYDANEGSGNGEWREEDGQEFEAEHGQGGLKRGDNKNGRMIQNMEVATTIGGRMHKDMSMRRHKNRT